MPFHIETSNDQKFLVVRHYGVVLVEEFEAVTRWIEEEFEDTKDLCMLVDIREAETYPDKAEFVLWLRNRIPSPPAVKRVAIIPGPATVETVEFMVLAAVNNGITMQRCTSIADGFAYLSEIP